MEDKEHALDRRWSDALEKLYLSAFKVGGPEFAQDVVNVAKNLFNNVGDAVKESVAPWARIAYDERVPDYKIGMDAEELADYIETQRANDPDINRVLDLLDEET